MYTLSLKEPILAQVNCSFHLSWGKVKPNCDRQVIAGLKRCVYLLLVYRRQAGQEFRVVGGCPSLLTLRLTYSFALRAIEEAEEARESLPNRDMIP